jgi:hypothetical protein
MSNDAGVSVEYQTPEQVQRRAKQLPGMTFRNVLDSGICPEGTNREYGRRAYKGGFENVDRLLKSPARKRGRDFAIILSCNPYEITRCFNLEGGRSPFETAGVMQDGKALTCTVVENYQGPRRTLGDVLVPDAEVPEEYFVPEGQLEKWRYLKGASASAA